MATLFKVGNGWKVQFAHGGKRRTLAAGEYKAAAGTLREKIEALITLALNGRQPDGDMREWLDGMDTTMREKLVGWGLLAGMQVAAVEPIQTHVDAYLDYCRREGQTGLVLANKGNHIARVIAHTKAQRLTDLQRGPVGAYLEQLQAGGAAPRTVNHCRQDVMAFLNWCAKPTVGKLSRNPLAGLAKLDETQDRRRIRRPLTDEELGRLLETVPESRRAFYLLAALAGLRRGDMRGITWGNVDLDGASLTIPAHVGKARREDTIPLHVQAVEALRAIRPVFAQANDPVFKTEVSNTTRSEDFVKAGLARKVDLGGGRVRYDTADAEGRMVDLHALRTTLGTQLARAGVAPQIAQRIMRHSDYATTLKHYTVLGLVDTAKAIAALPSIHTQVEALAMTGTHGDSLNGAAKSIALGRKNGFCTGITGGNSGGGMSRDANAETPINIGKTAFLASKVNCPGQESNLHSLAGTSTSS